MALAIMRGFAAVAMLVVANLHGTARAADDAVTPVEKVIDLLKNLRQEVDAEGSREAATYEKFACFCKDSTDRKSEEVTHYADHIDSISAEIEDKSQEQKARQKEMMERKKRQEELSAELDEQKERCTKDEHKHAKTMEELERAINGIGEALNSLNRAKAEGGASLIDLSAPAQETLELAKAIEVAQSQKRKDGAVFLQTEDWHSGGIVKVLKMLSVDYGKKKREAQAEFTKVEKGCSMTHDGIEEKLHTNKNAIDEDAEMIDHLGNDLAGLKETLVSEKESLADSKVYLDDLTHRCEARAKDWDQRSKARDEEIQAISQALEILEGKVQDAESANKRALLLSGKTVVIKAHATMPASEGSNTDGTELASELTAFETSNAAKEGKPRDDIPLGDSEDDVTAWLHGGAASFVQVDAVSTERRDKVLAFVQQEGRRIGSTALTSLALRIAADPFKKIKGLIQDLIEHLLEQSAQEATEKGFCDTETAKAKQERDFNIEESHKLSAEIQLLEVKLDGLHTEIDELKQRTEESHKELDEATELRSKEHEDNIKTLKEAHEGLDAVTDAHKVLKSFYDSHAAAASLLQASPVDEDAPAAPTGEYKGNQGAATGILGLLEVIMSDFDRTLRKTEKDEKKAAAEFETQKQDTLAAIAGHETKIKLDLSDAEATEAKIHDKRKDMKSAMEMVDGSLKTLEDLVKPCMERNRMSYADRVAKREQEIAALKEALTVLQPGQEMLLD